MKNMRYLLNKMISTYMLLVNQ